MTRLELTQQPIENSKTPLMLPSYYSKTKELLTRTPLSDNKWVGARGFLGNRQTRGRYRYSSSQPPPSVAALFSISLIWSIIPKVIKLWSEVNPQFEHVATINGNPRPDEVILSGFSFKANVRYWSVKLHCEWPHRGQFRFTPFSYRVFLKSSAASSEIGIFILFRAYPVI